MYRNWRTLVKRQGVDPWWNIGGKSSPSIQGIRAQTLVKIRCMQPPQYHYVCAHAILFQFMTDHRCLSIHRVDKRSLPQMSECCNLMSWRVERPTYHQRPQNFKFHFTRSIAVKPRPRNCNGEMGSSAPETPHQQPARAPVLAQSVEEAKEKEGKTQNNQYQRTRRMKGAYIFVYLE